jgi:hypothetical protein
MQINVNADIHRVDYPKPLVTDRKAPRLSRKN